MFVLIMLVLFLLWCDFDYVKINYWCDDKQCLEMICKHFVIYHCRACAIVLSCSMYLPLNFTAVSPEEMTMDDFKIDPVAIDWCKAVVVNWPHCSGQYSSVCANVECRRHFSKTFPEMTEIQMLMPTFGFCIKWIQMSTNKPSICWIRDVPWYYEKI